MRTKPAVIVVLAALALVAAPAALAADPGFGPPSTGSDSGEAIRWLYWFVFAICAVVFVAVEAALILFVIRFRRRGSTPPDAEGPQIHGNTRVEIIWTVIPAIILVAIAIFILRPLLGRAGHRRRPVERARRSASRAHQFYWEYVYPNGAISIDTLVLPVDRPVELELVTYDVIHSWWVPALTGKRDAIPGRRTRFASRRTGRARSRASAPSSAGSSTPSCRPPWRWSTEAEFETPRAAQGQDRARRHAARSRPAVLGAVCAKCHGLEGEGDIGPAIAGNGTLDEPTRADRSSSSTGANTDSPRATCPPSGAAGPRSQSTPSSPTSSHDQLAEPAGGRRAGAAQWPCAPRRSPPPGGGPRHQLADDGRPQADRHPLPRHRRSRSSSRRG